VPRHQSRNARPVDEGAEQPRLHRSAALEPLDPAHDREPRLLDDIVGRGPIVNVRQRQPNQSRLVALDQGDEGGFVAAAQRFHQRQVVAECHAHQQHLWAPDSETGFPSTCHTTKESLLMQTVIVATAQRITGPFLRISLAIVLAWIGALKFVDPSPVVSLLQASLPLLAFNAFVYLLGAVEIVTAVLLVTGIALPYAGLLTIGPFAGTLTIFVIAPGVTGFPFLTLAGQFLLKDLGPHGRGGQRDRHV
jgi:hypothetical protein